MNDAILRAAACEVRDAMLSSLPDDLPHYEASPRFERRMERLLADPTNYARKMLRPWQEKIARAAAMAAVSVGLSALLLSQLSPSAWAAVKRWFMEVRQWDIVYYFSGEATGKELPYYTITELPEGYVYAEEKNDDGYRRIRYENEYGQRISLEYMTMVDGSAFWVDTEQMAVRDVWVNGCPGQVFLSLDGEQGNAVLWTDDTANVQFFLDGRLDSSALLHIAESVSLAKTAKP